MRTKVHSSISLLLPIQSETSASRLLGLPTTFALVSCSAYSNLTMEAMCSSETSNGLYGAISQKIVVFINIRIKVLWDLDIKLQSVIFQKSNFKVSRRFWIEQ
jgi:hypothetical protein